MPEHSASRRTTHRWIRRALGALIALDLVVASGVVLLHANDESAPLSTDDAVEAFRQSLLSEQSGDGDDDNDDDDPAMPPATDEVDTEGAPAPAAGDGPSDTSEDTTAGGESSRDSTVSGQRTNATPDPQPSESTTTAPVPREGVYVYDTTGHESLDALGGARHDYPDETTITIRLAGCGLRERWQPLAERYDERSVCIDQDSHSIEWYESSRSFFGQTDTRRLECDPGAVAFSTESPPGTEYRHRCVDPDTDARNVVTVLPDESIVIDGETIVARRIRAISDVTGDSRAHSEIESWIHPDTGLTLRRESTLDGTSAGPSGDVRYHEEYVLQLRSLQPRT